MITAKQASDNKATAKRLSKLRTSKGIKASWVAERMGISSALLCYLELGQRHWNPEQVGKYLKAIGVQE